MSTNAIAFKDLPLSDNFMFGQVMRDERVSKLFLEALLGRSIAKIEYIDKEKDLSDTLGAHGIRLDVYIQDQNQTRYNIEMQCVNQKDLERRTRYYQGGIDRNFLERGGDYVDLPESYIIFICNFDYFHAGLALYERESCLTLPMPKGRGFWVHRGQPWHPTDIYEISGSYTLSPSV